MARGGKALGIVMSQEEFETLTLSGALTVSGTLAGAAITATNLTTTGNTQLGDAASDTFGAHGATPVIQSTYVASNSINALSVSGVIGFISSTSLSSLVGKVNTILQILSDHGFMAAS